ncbi:hypothetical protein MHBO_004329 [Bonamia ostreae]|uniref:Uncharacterized protein n=1 Tax=Bonamia ostreae TaxID=126728 RepID=A0ABV2AT06_9EUKA
MQRLLKNIKKAKFSKNFSQFQKYFLVTKNLAKKSNLFLYGISLYGIVCFVKKQNLLHAFSQNDSLLRFFYIVNDSNYQDARRYIANGISINENHPCGFGALHVGF